MDINAIIAVLLIFGIGTMCYWCGKHRSLQYIVEESKDDILKEFLQIFIVIAKDCMDILTISNDGKKLGITEDEYKELLAKKIVEVFDRDVQYNKAIFSDADKIAFVKNYVLSSDEVIEKLKTYFNKEEVINEATAIETLSSVDDGEPVNTAKNNMVDSINKYYDKE